MASPVHSFLKRNGLSVVLLVLFLAFLGGQVWAGLRVSNQERIGRGLPPQPIGTYLHGGHFLGATFENWESEFLQMGMYVVLTVALRQRGSAESRPIDPADEQERIDPGPTPRLALAGGPWRFLYANSLALVYLLLFLLAFSGHAYGSWLHENEERAMQGMAPVSLLDHTGGAEFWFESFQNWQSEFLAVLSIVLLTIFLRQDKSPESKPLRAPHSQTGT